MTLILGMSKPEGIYMCVDYRITNANTRAVIDDSSAKCLTVHYAPLGNGTKGLLAFTGLAVLPDGTPTLTWLRETLRGEPELPDQSMAHLRARLDRDFGPLRQPLIVNFLGLHEDKRFFGGMSNWASSGLTDIHHQGHRPGKDVHNGDHGAEEAPYPTVVHSGVQG